MGESWMRHQEDWEPLQRVDDPGDIKFSLQPNVRTHSHTEQGYANDQNVKVKVKLQNTIQIKKKMNNC